MTELPDIKKVLSDLLQAVSPTPISSKAMEEIFVSDTELDCVSYREHLCPMHRKIVNCYNLLEEWRQNPDKGKRRRSTILASEVYWILTNSDEAIQYLTGICYIGDTTPFADSAKLRDTCLTTNYAKLHSVTVSELQEPFDNLIHTFTQKLEAIINSALPPHRFEAHQVAAMLNSFLAHVALLAEKYKDRWENHIKQTLEMNNKMTENDAVKLGLTMALHNIKDNYWGRNYPEDESGLMEFIISLRQQSGSGHEDELSDLFLILAEQHYLRNRNQASRAPAAPIAFTDMQQRLLQRAVKQGFIVKEEGRMKWQRTQGLLDYFLGKMLCSDYIIRNDEGNMEWCRSENNTLPATQLNELFGRTNIGFYRNKRNVAPKDYEQVDELFKGLKYDSKKKSREER